MTVLPAWWLRHGSTTSPQLMQDWFPSKMATAKWLMTCLQLCKARPDPCTAGDNPFWISSPEVLPAGLSHLPLHPPLPESPNSFSSSFPTPCRGIPLPSTPFPRAAGSPGAWCYWLRRGPRVQQPQHPTPVHGKTWQHWWHVPIAVAVTPGTKAPCSCHPPGLG